MQHTSYHTTEEGYGRFEKRSIYITEEIDWLPGRTRWKNLRSVALLISERKAGAKTIIERRMYISSLEADAKQIAHAIRSHSQIEVCHWLLDVSFREDSLKARTRAHS
ncbi:MAG: ISAs1 family transposase [Candidatus Neptunochlamydia sp.]|nr:ISAs1 family transposase [Candidatus Neptunochlamydia sp.]